eukprot:13723078-Alexandrium_andersonii.AAC.1
MRQSSVVPRYMTVIRGTTLGFDSHSRLPHVTCSGYTRQNDSIRVRAPDTYALGFARRSESATATVQPNSGCLLYTSDAADDM